MDLRRTPTRSRFAAALCAAMFACALSLASPAAAAGANSADRLIMWTACKDVAALTDAELDTWQGRGVDGFACNARHLRHLGGTQEFTGDPNASLSGTSYSLQRSLRDSNILGRMRARGMKAYLGVYLVNYYNSATPLAEWFDDGAWSQAVLPKIDDLAAAARQLGFAGVAFDHELYGQVGGVETATWDWDYPGNGRSEQKVRAKVRQRGEELMTRLVGRFPGIEVLSYGVEFRDTWHELVQKQVNGVDNAYADRVDIDFFDGLSSVRGYGALRLSEATFYKTPHLGSWESAFQYHFNSTYALLSRRLSNWAYAASRLHISPFSWIDPGPCGCAGDTARPVGYVAEQLRSFRKWGMGGEFTDYSYGGLRRFDYSPYASAMSAASTPAVVESTEPSLAVTSAVKGTGGKLTVRGTAGDNLAIRAVRWRNDRGGSGAASAVWQVDSGDYRTGYTWHTDWTIPELPLEAGENRITIEAEDIKGLTTTSTVRVTGEGSVHAPDVSRPESAAPTQPKRGSSRGQRLSRRAVKRCHRRAKHADRAQRAARRKCLRSARRRARARRT